MTTAKERESARRKMDSTRRSAERCDCPEATCVHERAAVDARNRYLAIIFRNIPDARWNADKAAGMKRMGRT